MSKNSNTGKSGGTATATETKKATTATPAAGADVNVQETAPAASTAAPMVAQASAEESVPKVRLFHRKACDSVKDSTMTALKEGESFKKTGANVQIPNPDEATKEETPYVTVPVYSLKRGKRIYYTPYVTPEQATAADALAQKEADEKAQKEAAKKAEKEKKEAEKLAAAPAAQAAAAPAAAGGENGGE